MTITLVLPALLVAFNLLSLDMLLPEMAEKGCGRFMSDLETIDWAAERLSAVFNRGGYVRRRNAGKGHEIRFVVESRSELASVRRLLRIAGFEPGRPFTKSRKFVLPVYGHTTVRQLLRLFDDNPAA